MFDSMKSFRAELVRRVKEPVNAEDASRAARMLLAIDEASPTKNEKTEEPPQKADDDRDAAPPRDIPAFVKMLRNTLSDPDASDEDKVLAKRLLRSMGEAADEENAKALANVFGRYDGGANRRHVESQRAAIRPGGTR